MQGYNGTDGRPGSRGLPGKIGTAGLPGRRGLPGKLGTPGSRGLPGKLGRAGIPGRMGLPGKSKLFIIIINLLKLTCCFVFLDACTIITTYSKTKMNNIMQ